MEHRILHPFFLIIGYSQTLEEFFLSGKVSMKCGGKKRLAESSGTTQKNILHLLLPEVNDILGLIYIEIIAFANILEGLNTNGIKIYKSCHNPTCFILP